MQLTSREIEKLMIYTLSDVAFKRKARGLKLNWICPYISRHLLSLNPLLACCRRYSRGER